jgi:hypothetical protein
MILLCQGAGRLWTGLGGATPVGGQALIRSHGRRGCGRVRVDRSLEGQHSWCVSRFDGVRPSPEFQVMCLKVSLAM